MKCDVCKKEIEIFYISLERGKSNGWRTFYICETCFNKTKLGNYNFKKTNWGLTKISCSTCNKEELTDELNVFYSKRESKCINVCRKCEKKKFANVFIMLLL